MNLPGVLKDRFFIQKELGRGAYGRVFRAKDLLDDITVAVKMSHGDKWRKKRNLIEAHVLRAIQLVDSPYRKLVVDMKTFHEIDDCVVVVMELLHCNLMHYIDQYDFTFNMASLYARQMIEFLVFMKQLDIIHGDIKPENILLRNGSHEIKFADFGLCHSPLISPEPKLKIIQTLPYRAPEVVLGFDYDASVDVWSTGCVLMECLTGVALLKPKSELELLRGIEALVGLPAQEVIHEAPKRDEFFYFHEKHQKWTLKGREPANKEPLGLKYYLKKFHSEMVNVDDELCVAFLDLVGRMLRVDPCRREQPEELHGHGFLLPSPQ